MSDAGEGSPEEACQPIWVNRIALGNARTILILAASKRYRTLSVGMSPSDREYSSCRLFLSVEAHQHPVLPCTIGTPVNALYSATKS